MIATQVGKMLPLSGMVLAMILAVVVQYVDGNQRIVRVSELISDDEDSAEDDNSHICCVYGNCSCNFLDHALTNLTSDVLINITTDVTLSSLVKVSDIENVSIIGHNNPTVNCKSVGGVHFTFCHNCIIQGITWDGCGTKNTDNYTKPGLELSCSSDVTIQNCSFQHSVGQAVVLSEALGDVNITNCKFVNNSHYRGHGAAIHYSSNDTRNSSQLVFTINNCNFSDNKMKSLVFLESNLFKYNKIRFIDTIFCNNQGISVYAINHKIYFSGEILFWNNLAEHGTGVYITDHSNVIFDKNSNVTFIENSANNRGGAVFLRNHSICLFDQNSIVTFNNNKAANGTIYSKISCNVTFKANCKVAFSNNTAIQCGAAIYSVNNSHVTFTGKANVAFNNNIVLLSSNYYHRFGGILYLYYNCNISFEGNSTTVFSNNTADYGGAILFPYKSYSYISFKGNSTSVFSNNIAHHRGGALYSDSFRYISFEGNSTTLFNGNTADYGGAIVSIYNYISFKEISTTLFSNNIAANLGGAIYSDLHSYVSFEGKSTTKFSNNTADYGGAIYSDLDSYIYFEENSTSVFSNNTAHHRGGALYFDQFNHISFEGNSTTLFNGNTADFGGAIISFSSYISFTEISTILFNGNTADYGGAITSFSSYISFKEISTILFNGNTADYGGALYFDQFNHISFEGNSTTLFNGNTADFGGAITYFSSYISFKEISTTLFNGNTADYGGALYFDQFNHISFEGNSTTLFNGNTADHGGAIVSIYSYIYFEENSTSVFSNNTAKYGGALSAYHGNITFGDNSNVTFNDNNATFGATVFSNSQSKILARDHSNVAFNGLSPKWCNNVCLPYTGQGDAVTIDNDGIVWCSDRKSFKCQSHQCKCIDFRNIKPDNLVNISNKVVILGTLMEVFGAGDVAIIGHNNPTVICVEYGGLSLWTKNNSNLIIKGITWIGCGVGSYTARYTGTEDFIDIGVFSISGYRNVTIQNCSFQHSMGQIMNLKDVQYVNIDDCKFVDSRSQEATIFSSSQDAQFNVFTINNCIFNSNRNAKKLIYFECSHNKHNIIYLSNSSFSNNQGVSIYLSSYTNLHINGNVLFEYNVAENGAGIYINDHSTLIFSENSNTMFNSNSVHYNGASVFLNDHSNVIFDKNSTVRFTDNKATNGTIYSKAGSTVTFNATCEVTFSSNSAKHYGSAIYSSDNSQVTFTGNASVNFTNNVVSSNDMDLQFGGTIFSGNIGSISFEENSSIVFCNNIADFGAAILSIQNAAVVFKDRSTVMLNNNTAHYCGIMPSSLLSVLTFMVNGNTVMHSLTSNYRSSAGTICALHKSKIKFSGHSLVTFINNTGGGAIVLSNSNVIIEKYSTIAFINNIAQLSSGGAFLCSNNSNVTIKGNSNVTFNGNKASQSGGAIYSYNICNIMFKDNSTSTFSNNIARNNGGAILSNQYSEITFEGNSIVTFDGNTADNGGTFYITNSAIMFKETSKVSFYNNHARQNSGVGYFSLSTKVIFEGNTIVTFNNNTAEQNAGVLYIAGSKILFKENSTVTLAYNKATLNCGALCLDSSSDVSCSEFTNIIFHHNRAFYGGAILANDFSNITLTGNSGLLFANNTATQSGGAGYFNSTCNFNMQEDATVTLDNNIALHGGAICIKNKSQLLFEGNSTAFFCNNIATVGGGALQILNNSSIILNNHTTIKFINNNAQYGGAIFLDTTAVMVNNSDSKCINFMRNIAKVLGKSVYEEATESCNSNCVINRTVGMSSEYIATPPNKLKFYDPAKCIDNNNNAQCERYYIQNIMLGTEIIVPASVLDYYNQSVDSIQFLVHSETHSNYLNSGPKDVLISNNKFAGVNIIGNQTLSKLSNFSINVTLNTALNSNWKQISLKLIIELSPCHPGFWQYPNSKRCKCYNANDIVFCSGSNSTIKRGYWFGNVSGNPTVTFCPFNYCNFSCCETSNGYYHLSPVRVSQCRHHRCGTACGDCEEGYTLSFDSVECINVKECSTGNTIIVLALILLYWIAIITAVFSLMHFKVGMGYLYAITFYYSVVDLLLSQNLYPSDALYTVVNIMSSVAKIIPQFLGKFCFIKNINGIDQQFIHYIHPVAISLFLVMVTVFARRSRRLSDFISKGIIHVICCLLLLSYTSLATTSLLLMRPLIFHDVDEVYTYVSPDIEYFHGRHLAYAIVAVLFTVVIVIGLPLLLALEPFLNSKMNFIKIKPLLDQFQGCYKDKYRYFAAYYMICRLVIIIIIIANSSNDFIFQYLLITACVIVALVHHSLRPYSSSLLNVFDGVILHFLVLVSASPLVESFDNFSSNLLVGIMLVLVILPLLIFVAVSLMINKAKIKRLPGYCYTKCSQLRLRNYNEIPLNETEEPSDEEEFVNVIDDSRRVNATICEV